MRRLLAWHALVAILAIAEFGAYGTVASAYVTLILTLAGREAWHSRRDWADQRRYSIGGDYETVTTGSQPLKGETQDAEGRIYRDLRLHQTGKRVHGDETPKAETGNKTVWELSGEVFSGAIDGTWAKKAPAATASRGSFHLEQSHVDPTKFEGQWIGWDAGKRQQGHGDHVWIRKADGSPAWTDWISRRLHR